MITTTEPKTFPYEVMEKAGLHWHTFVAGGELFAQVRYFGPGTYGCSGKLNKLWVRELGVWREVRHVSDPILLGLPTYFIVDGDCHLDDTGAHE